jgi:hypothetical protein
MQGNKVVYMVLEDNYNVRRLNDDGSLGQHVYDGRRSDYSIRIR